MKRKVIKQGNGTLTITLPKQWTVDVGLKGGEEIDVREEEGNIIVGSKPETTSETTIQLEDIEISGDDEKNPNRYIVRTLIINALRKGHDKIKILFDSPKVLPIINNCVSEVIGYEIIEQGPKHCIVGSIADLKDIDFIKHFTRFKQLVHLFSNLVFKHLVQGEHRIEEIDSLFLMLEKNYNTFSRFLMYTAKRQTKEKFFLFTATEHLYQGTRNMFYCSKLYSEIGKELSQTTAKYAKDVFDYVNKVLDFITTKEISKVAELNIKKNSLTYHSINKIISSNSKENALLLQLAFVARRMWDSVGPYLGYIE
ncbi:MAG TPA: AbrB/MazE/SpoVT family DNA-binding domain-containing protein [archaeon]|nr:AbrB/MazE/SpoVT family DNA-binding domain-containing protein [archaeon]